MRDLSVLKSQLLLFQEEIQDDLKPYFLEKMTFLEADKWHYDSPNISVKSDNQSLYVACENAAQEDISFLEQNNSFKHLYNELKVLPDEELEVIVEGETSGEIDIQAKIKEFSYGELVNIHLISLNEKVRIQTSDRTNAISLVLQVSGMGKAVIHHIDLSRVKEPIEEHSLSVNQYMKKTAPTQIADVQMACIFDEFSMTCFEKEVNLITFTPANWQEVLTDQIPDVLFVESAWRGNFGAWEYKIAKYNNQDKTPLIQLLNWCKQNKIPTVFWNKEDPIHFERFIDTAKLFDYIFTTDANMIENYQEACGHQNVFSLSFSAEPKLHNPIKIQEKRLDKICFAGSFYANRHEERRKDMENILDIAAKFGLDIFDRNYAKNTNGTTHFSFPERFSENILGSLKYDEIDKAYKGYKVMLNVNSVKYSPTMFSRRVFEGLACGTPIISSYSEGIKKIFKDIVIISEDEQELERNIHQLMTDEDFYRQKALEGIREVYLHHTYKHRIQYILKKMGIHFGLNTKKVSVISVVQSKSEFYQMLEQFEDQTWREKEWIVFLDNFDGYIDLLNQYNKENIKTYVLSYMNHYSRLTEVINNKYVAYFSPNNYYGENYLLDLMLATEYSQADIIGKSNMYFYDNQKAEISEINQNIEYEYVDELQMSAAVMKIDIFQGEDLMTVISKMRSESSTSSYFKRGYRLLSTDKYNFIQNGFQAGVDVKNKFQK